MTRWCCQVRGFNGIDWCTVVRTADTLVCCTGSAAGMHGSLLCWRSCAVSCVIECRHDGTTLRLHVMSWKTLRSQGALAQHPETSLRTPPRSRQRCTASDRGTHVQHPSRHSSCESAEARTPCSLRILCLRARLRSIRNSTKSRSTSPSSAPHAPSQLRRPGHACTPPLVTAR